MDEGFAKVIKNSYLFISIVFVLLSYLTTIYWVFNVAAHIGPDESGHIALTQQFKNAGFFDELSDPITSFNLGASSREPSLYHYTLAKVSFVPNFLNLDEVVVYRLNNLMFVTIFLYFCFKLLHLLTSSYFTRSIVIILLIHTSMLYFLFATVNYDSLIIASALAATYYFFLFLKLFKFKHLMLFIIISLVGCLTKPTVIPLFLIQSAIIATLSYSRFPIKKIKISSNIPMTRRLLTLFLLGLIVVLGFVNFYYWGQNLITFNSLQPSCDRLYGDESCRLNGIYNRRYTLYLDTPLDNSFYRFVNYSLGWPHHIVNRSLGIFSHNSIDLNQSFITGVLLFLLFAVVILIRKISLKFHSDNTELIIVLFVLPYLGLILATTYEGFLKTGVDSITVQGRYLFPTIVPIYYLIASAYSYIFKSQISRLFFLFFLAMILHIFTTSTVLLQSTERAKYVNHFADLAKLNTVLHNYVVALPIPFDKNTSILFTIPVGISEKISGEITEGFTISQPFEMSQSAAKYIRSQQQKDICANIKLANYNNRLNIGKALVSLNFNQESQTTEIIDYSDVLDNQYHKVCFTNLDLAQISSGKFSLDVIGLAGESGSSITAWTTTSNRHPSVIINGEENKTRILQFYFDFQDQ